MATDPSLPAELKQAAARVTQLRGELAATLVPVTAYRAMLFWTWRGPQSSHDVESLSKRGSEIRRVNELLGDLAAQLRGAASTVQARLDEEARQRALAEQRAREQEAARLRAEQQR